MRKVTANDILSLYEYEKVRPVKLKEIIELKRRRRLRVGDIVSLVFENYETVWFQIQEMVRTEKVFREEDIEAMVRMYNDLIPEEGELSATMFVELPEEREREHLLPKLVGIHEEVYLRVGERHRIRAQADPKSAIDYSTGRASTLHFLKWRLTPEQVEAFREEPAAVEISHSAYRAEAVIPPELKEELLKDLGVL